MSKARSSAARGLPRSVFLPYPELVEPCRDGRRWQIEDSNDHVWLPSNGVTDKHSRRIFVPLEAGGEDVSLHELAHVRWSPDRFPRVRYPPILLQAVEDARINLGLESIGLPIRLDREQLAHVAHLAAQDAKAGAIAATLVRAIASLGTDAAGALREEILALSPRARAIALPWLEAVESRLLRARARVDSPVAPFRVAARIARDLARDLDRHGLLRGELEVPGVGCCQVALACEDEEEGEGFRFGARLRGYRRLLRKAARRGRGEDFAVGRMSISYPPLAIGQPPRSRGGESAMRCALEGTRIARPDRLALDRAIFHRRGCRGGGTVLIDNSGSMSLSEEDVERIVEAAGGSASVAIYSGRGDVGELRVIASRGRRAASEYCGRFGMGNIVDLPALEWLAKQPGPRLWLSDGGVTGVGDAACEELLEACLELVDRMRITRVDDTSAAIEALESRRMPRPT